MPVKYDWFTGSFVDVFTGDEGNKVIVIMAVVAVVARMVIMAVIVVW